MMAMEESACSSDPSNPTARPRKSRLVARLWVSSRGKGRIFSSYVNILLASRLGRG